MQTAPVCCCARALAPPHNVNCRAAGAGDALPATTGMGLAPDHRLKTGAGGEVGIQFEDNSAVRLASQSVVTFDSLTLTQFTQKKVG